MSEERCLHCDINDIVREHIDAAGDAPINLPELIAKVSESLVDLIMLGPEEQWGNLLAEAIRQIGDAFLEGAKLREDGRVVGRLRERRCVEGCERHGVRNARRLAEHIADLLDDVLGTIERGARRQLRDGYQIALVLFGYEARRCA